jgi:flagellin
LWLNFRINQRFLSEGRTKRACGEAVAATPRLGAKIAHILVNAGQKAPRAQLFKNVTFGADIRNGWQDGAGPNAGRSSKKGQGCSKLMRIFPRNHHGGFFMVINHNLSAMFADRSLKVNQLSLDKGSERLSSGMRINRAGDDASGLAVSEKMRSQIRGLNRASANAADDISFIQTAEGYLQESQDILQRIRELAVQSANGIYTEEDRMQIQVEVSQLIDEVDRIASHAQFNGMNMLTGRFARATGNNTVTGSMWFHIGANMDQREQVYVGTMTAKGLGIRDVADDSILSLETADLANRAISTLDASLTLVSKQRADLGAYQNRLEHAIKGIDIGAENLQASESRIRDTNMAKTMVKYTTDQILSQSGVAMLAQANQRATSVLSLLQ